MIQKSKHFVVFTGAGLSTSAGIPDYRSGANTVLATGAGKWEKKANIDLAQKSGKLVNPPVKIGVDEAIEIAQPTLSHMSLVELMNKGYLKHIISQNVDGLHVKSGIPLANISELHGNNHLEICEYCERSYMRTFNVRKVLTKNHKTGRKCNDTKC